MIQKPRQNGFLYHINASSQCVGCKKCETACFHANHKRIQKMNICQTSAIGVLPGNTNDYWPMIIPEFCNGCGECVRVCPDKRIERIIWKNCGRQK